MVDSESGEGQTLSTTEEREKKIESLVMQWGKDRGILENSTPFGQLQKTLEESVELLEAVLHEDVLDIEDAIGDIWVTLVMVRGCGCESLGKPPCCEPDDALADMTSAALARNIIQRLPAMFHEALVPGEDIDELWDCCKQIELYLQAICWKWNLNYLEAKYAAYEQIKDRKGYLRPDGVFVKEA